MLRTWCPGISSGAGLSQPRAWGYPPAPAHQLPQSFCSTVPGGKKLPPHSQGQAASSRQTPPEGTDGRAPAKGAPRPHGLVAPLHPPLPRAPSPLPTLTLHTVQQSPLGAEAALHTGDGPAGPPRLRTVVVARGGARGATGLIHLAPLTLQSWVGRREAWVTRGRGPQEATAAGEPAQSEARGGHRGVWMAWMSCRVPAKAICNTAAISACLVHLGQRLAHSKHSRNE